MSKKNKDNKRKIKILVWGDSPYCSTGFGNVVRGIFGTLAKTGKYEIDILGINDTGGAKDPTLYPGMRVWPAMPGSSVAGDFHGRGRFVQAVFNKDPEIIPPWDIIFTINDPFVLDQRFKDGFGTMKQLIKAQLSYLLQADPRAWFKIVSYWPVDSKLKPNWVADTVGLPDVVVPYTEYGQKEIIKANNDLKERMIGNLEDKMTVIYHGYDSDKYFPLSPKDRKEFRDTFFEGKVTDNTFLVTVVARNQMRKDIPRAMKIFAEFKKRRPDSLLYINAKETDAWGSLKDYGYQLGLEVGTDFLVPNDFDERTGVSMEMLNGIYNASDVVLSTNLGEGFGMTYVEAMGAGVLNLAPYHTTTPEILGLTSPEINEEARGIAFKAGSTKSEFVFLGPQDLMRERPLGNVEDAVQKLIWIYDNPEKAKKIADNGHAWIQNYRWKDIAKVWDELFEKVYNGLELDRSRKDEIRSDLKEKLGIEK